MLLMATVGTTLFARTPMTLPTEAFLWASFVVALVVTLGAVPACAHLLRTLTHREADDRTLETAGLGLFVGIAVASFYFAAWPSNTLGLTLSAVFALAAGTAIDVLERRGRLLSIDLQAKIVLSAVAICGVWIDLDHWPNWPLGMALLVGAGVMVLVAMARIGQDYEDEHPGLTVYLTITTTLGLLLIGWIGENAGVMDPRAVATVLAIAIPGGGALLAAAYYMVRLPWRGKPVVFTGTGGHMMLAVGCVWIALTLALTSADGARSPAALVWAVGVPLFYFVRQQAATLVAGLLARDPAGWKRGTLGWLDRELAYQVSPMLLPLTSLTMSGIGAFLLANDIRQLVSWPAWLAAMIGFILLPAAIRHTPLAASSVIYRPRSRLAPSPTAR